MASARVTQGGTAFLVLSLATALAGVSSGAAAGSNAETPSSRPDDDFGRRLDALLPPLVPERVALTELLRELADDPLGASSSGRWERLRLRGQLMPSEEERRSEAESLLAAMEGVVARDHPGRIELRLRLAELLSSHGEVEASGAISAEIVSQVHSLPPATRFAAGLARARWLRRAGALASALGELDAVEGELANLSSDGEWERSALEEERGATHFLRGDWQASVAELSRALDRRRAAEPAEWRDLALRLAAARVALRAARLRDPVASGVRLGETEELDRELHALLAEIVALSPDDPVRPEVQLDRAWALAVSASLHRAGWEGDQRSALVAAGATLFERAARAPPTGASGAGSEGIDTAAATSRAVTRERANHLSSWSLALYPFAQELYAANLASFGEAGIGTLARAEAARDRAESLLREGELRESRELLRAAADAVESRLGTEHLETSWAQAELAEVEWRSSGELPTIEAALQRLAGRLASALGTSNVPRAVVLAELGTVLAEMGSYASALDAAREAREMLLRELAPTSPLLAGALPMVAWTFRVAGAPAELEATLVPAPQDESLLSCATLDRTRGVMLAELRLHAGDLESAKRLLREEVRRCASNGVLRANLEPLEEMLERGYAPRREPRGAVGLDDFANRRAKRLGAAKLLGWVAAVTVPIAALALAGDEDLSWSNTSGASDDLEALSWSAGALAGATAFTAREVRRPSYALVPVVDPHREASFYFVAGEVLRASGLRREAVALARGAVAGMESGAGREHPRLADVLRDLAAALWDASAGEKGGELAADETEARSAAVRSARIVERVLRDGVSTLPEQQALWLVASRPRPEEILFSGALHGRNDPRGWRRAAWEWTLGRRALVLDELASRHRRAMGSETEEVADTWSAFVDARRRLATLWVRGPEAGHAYWEELAEASRRRDQAESAFAAASRAAGGGGGRPTVGLKEVAAALPLRSALVEFVRTGVRRPGERERRERYLALTLAAEEKTTAIDLGAAAEIDSLVESWLRDLRESSRDPSASAMEELPAAGSELRARVWDPVAAHLGGIDLVFLVLDGTLHQVQFGALPTDRGQFLVESGPTLHVLSTARDLFESRRSAPPVDGGLLALADPDYARAADASIAPGGDEAFRGVRPHCAALGRREWSALPESRREVEEIAALFAGRAKAEVLLGTAANETRLKREAAGRRYLHLATHGYFLGEECAAQGERARGIGGLQESGAAPSEPGPAVATPDAQQVEAINPLLLSGLVLAGASSPTGGDGGEDGIVTAEELAALDLRGVEMAALSACDTGRGAVENGEGVFGLRRALEVSGVRTVLMSLWPVPDETARRWMTAFYPRRLAGESVASAARAASLECLASVRSSGRAPHPYLWAGFVAGGDWR